MRTSFLKPLDAALSPAACFLAARLPRPDGAIRGRILIVRPGGLGDLICADMALEELSLDAREYTWLIESRSRAWAEFRRLSYHCYDADPVKTARELRAQFSLVINTEQRFGLAEAFALWARAKEGSLHSFDTNRGAAFSDATVAYDWRERHETVEFARLFARALQRPEPDDLRPTMRPRLHPASGPPMVVIAGRQNLSRRLDLEAWAALIPEWHQDEPFLIAAAPEDADFAAQLLRRFDKLAVPFTGNFADLCGQIGHSPDILTMDGGPVHIASYFGVPALVFFTSGRDRKWRPLGEGSQVIRRHDLPCQPCTKFGQVPVCFHRFACKKLENIPPRRV